MGRWEGGNIWGDGEGNRGGRRNERDVFTAETIRKTPQSVGAALYCACVAAVLLLMMMMVVGGVL